MTPWLRSCSNHTVEAMQATIDDETAAQLDRDRARYGVARGRAVSEQGARLLRGRVAWRHPEDSPSRAPVEGTCFADFSGLTGWSLVWSPDSVGFLGGGSWDHHLEQFTALDNDAREIMAFVAAQRAADTEARASCAVCASKEPAAL